MRTWHYLFLAVLAPVLSLSPGLSQTPSGKDKPPESKPKEPKPVNEDEKVRDAIKDVIKAQETERDKLLKELQKLPGFRRPEGGDDFNLWFDTLAGGRGVWAPAEKGKTLREFFERVAGRLNVPEGPITREQFLRYARQYLAEGSSPPWKTPAETGAHQSELTKAFARLDRNGDGLLAEGEMSELLRGERTRWDADRDGSINPREYTAYFEGRMQQLWNEVGAKPAPPAEGPDTPVLPPPPPPAEEEPRPAVYRPGRLPADLPAWFADFDRDRDAQVGLYEWRHRDRPPEEFEKMDRNRDGYLTAEELLRFLRAGGGPAKGPDGKGPGY